MNKKALTAGLIALVLGCTTPSKIPLDQFYPIEDIDETTVPADDVPKIPLDQFYRIAAVDNLIIEIDTENNDEKDVISRYTINSTQILENGNKVISLLDYQGSNKTEEIIQPDSFQIPEVSPDEIYAIQVDHEKIRLEIDTKKDGDIDLIADFNISCGPIGDIYLHLTSYETKEGDKYVTHPNLKDFNKSKTNLKSSI
jgi:hypothetical protein